MKRARMMEISEVRNDRDMFGAGFSPGLFFYSAGEMCVMQESMDQDRSGDSVGL